MGVVGGAVKFLFCEGEPGPDKPASFDSRLLNRLLRGKAPTAVIVPAGGKHQLRAFIRGRLAVERAPNYLAYRDRDFDAEPTSTVSLIPFRSGQPIYMSHRATIENYLMDAALIHRYWNEASSGGPSWVHGGSPGEDDIRSWMDEAAGQLTQYQAVRWALASLKPSDRWPELSTTWTKGSGALPSSLDEAECIRQAKSMVNEVSAAMATISEAHLVAKHKRFSDLFTAPKFVDQAEYLVWYHGKDLMKQMQKLRPNSISLEHFCGWAVENLDWAKHADLKELAGRL